MRNDTIPSGGIPLSRGVSSEQFVEKSFLYLLLVSVVLHLAGFAALLFWPQSRPPQLSEPTFIDLQDMPELKTPLQEPPKMRPSDQKRRVLKETAPKPRVPALQPQTARRPASSPSAGRPDGPSADRPAVSSKPQAAQPSDAVSSAGELLRRRPRPSGGSTAGDGAKPSPNLMPSAGRMARLEENYRRRFADDLDEGTTRFLNTDDIQFGSFLRRFETAVYGVWRYPQEAAMKGIEGVTPVKITFNRKGEIVKVQLLETSGSRILDDEVFRTLRLVGPVGSLPKSYDKDEFNLIAFFQYGNARSRLR